MSPLNHSKSIIPLLYAKKKVVLIFNLSVNVNIAEIRQKYIANCSETTIPWSPQHFLVTWSADLCYLMAW